MKFILALGFVATIALAGDSPGAGGTGRYTLLAAPLDAVLVKGNDASKIPLNVVLKIDTVTGQTWTLRMTATDSGFHAEWVQIK